MRRDIASRFIASALRPLHQRRFNAFLAGWRDPVIRLPLAYDVAPARPQGRVCVVLHAYYTDGLDEFRRALGNLGFAFALYASTDTAEKAAAIAKTFAEFSPKIRIFENRGRDIAPKFVGFRDIYAAYDFVLFLHTKKSLHTEGLDRWRPFLLEALAGTPQIVASIFELFHHVPRLGVIAPRNFAPIRRYMVWGENFDNCRALAQRMGMTLKPYSPLDFAAGSMFWARTKALAPLLDLNLSFADFGEETGVIDGTLAHAIERMIFYTCERAGYRWVHAGAFDQPEPFERALPVESAAAIDGVLASAPRLLPPRGQKERRLLKLAKDYYDLLRSGLFAHQDYARAYFGTPWLAPLALPHYLSSGEARGLRPNPFFDPGFFEEQAGTRHLVDYLFDMNLWRHPTSDFFDSRWYTEKYAADLLTTENPLKHFWTKGFDKDFRGSHRFDTQFFKRAVARDRKDPKAYAFSFAAAPHDQAPLNMAELEALQHAFAEAIELKILKRADRPDKRFLVFIQAGHDYRPPYDLKAASFDLLINCYDTGAPPADAHYVFAQKGTKTTAIRKILDTCPEVLTGYEAVLFLDDDIVIAQGDIDSLFATQAEHGLDLLQAALSEDSECYYPILKKPLAGSGLRVISGVEIMMLLISKRALLDCGWVFSESISGWCVDALLSHEVRKRFGHKIALLADVVARHPRATDTANNAFYRFLAAHGIDPRVEAGKIAMKYNINDKMSAVDFRIIDPAELADEP